MCIWCSGYPMWQAGCQGMCYNHQCLWFCMFMWPSCNSYWSGGHFSDGVTPRDLVLRVHNLEMRLLELESRSMEYHQPEVFRTNLCFVVMWPVYILFVFRRLASLPTKQSKVKSWALAFLHTIPRLQVAILLMWHHVTAGRNCRKQLFLYISASYTVVWFALNMQLIAV